MFRERSWAVGLCVMGLSLVACEGSGGKGTDTPARSDAGAPGTEDVGGPGGVDAAVPAPTFEASRANLRFKGAARLREELSRVLRLPPTELCRELGQHDCIESIHQIALGGVEPYRQNILVPFAGIAVGASLAVERVALAACGERVRRDFEAPDTSVYFGRLPLAGDALASAEGAEVDAALTRLVREALLREPTTDDLATLRGLYADVVAEGGPQPARTWATLACVAVLTTTEFLLF